MGSAIFSLCGKFSVKADLNGQHHADVGLLPFVITPTGEELMLFQAARLGLLDQVYLDDFISRKALHKFANDFNFISDETTLSNHAAYYCSYDHLKVFAKEGPVNFSFHFVLDDSCPWMVVKHWIPFQDVFLLFRGRIMTFMETLDFLRDNNPRAYHYINNTGPAPERIQKLCVFQEKIPKQRKSKAYKLLSK